MPISPLVVLAALSGLSCAIAGWVVRQRWARPGADWFAVAAASCAIWAVGYGAGMLVFDPGYRLLFEAPIWVGHGIAPVAFLVFVSAYTGRLDAIDRRWVWLLWLVPAITITLVVTSPLHDLMWSNYRVVPTLGAATTLYEKGPWLYVHKCYSYAVLLAAAAILFEMIVDRDAIYTVQGAMLVLAMVPLGVGSVVWVLGVGPFPQVTATPFLFGVVFGVGAVVLFRSSVVDSPPAARRLGRERVFDDLADGICILDRDGRIVEHNDAAGRLLSGDEGRIVGRPIHDCLDAELRIEPGRHRVDLVTDGGRRAFEVSISAVTDDDGDRLGHGLVFHDVSAETRRRQQLSVLNRVLRHNLRNDMTIVRAYAEDLADDPDPDRRARAETIVDEVDGLLSLSEGARTIEAVLGVDDADPTDVALRSLAASIRAQYEAASIECRIDDDASLRTHEPVLEAVLEAAVDNAVEHSDSETPRVELAAESDGDWTTITVADDGPGIPDHERAPLESGIETALEHGSGLGLWLIVWGTSRLGGDVSIETPDDGGTTVRFRLPNEL